MADKASNGALDSAGAGAGAGASASASAKNENITFAHLGDLSINQGERIFTKGKGFAGLPTPEQPTFVLLIGTPGSGKSTALARLPELVGLDPEEAVQISLDSLVESVRPFRAETANIAGPMLAELTNVTANNVSTIAKQTSGPYLKYMRLKKNNREGRVGQPLPMSLNEMRYALLEAALAQGKNIIYERTISDSKKDILKAEVFEKIRASGKPYKIYVVYTKIDDVDVLRERLRRRPLLMMERKPAFFRGVPPSLGKKFIDMHEEYFVNFLLPLQAQGVQLVVVFWDGREDLYIPPKPSSASAAPPENNKKTNKSANLGGGNRKTRRRKNRKTRRR